MNKVLVLGAIEPFCDLVKEIKSKGLEPICCDYYSFAAAKKQVELSYDISTSDVISLCEIARQNNVSGIISAFSDRNLSTTLNLANLLGLPTFYNDETISILTDKIKMKACFANNGIPVIPYMIVSADFNADELEKLEMPIIVKPVDGYGSKGISICESVEEVRERVCNVTSASLMYKDRFIVEEYYDADEISISAWVKDGVSYVTSTYDVGRNVGKAVTLSYVAFPSKYEAEYGERFRETIQTLTTYLGIKEGPVTLQCYIGSKGFRVGEYLYRLAGGSPYLYAVELGGPNTAKMLIDFQIGNKIDYQNLETFKASLDYRYYDILVYAKKCNNVYYSFTKESLMSIDGGVTNVILYHKDGEDLSDNPNSLILISRIFYCRRNNDDRKYADIVKDLLAKLDIVDELGNDIGYIRIPNIDFEKRYWKNM